MLFMEICVGLMSTAQALWLRDITILAVLKPVKLRLQVLNP
jgi:hypothetical protein